MTKKGKNTQNSRFIIDKDGLGQLIVVLREGGWTVIGPVVGDGSIIYDEINSVDDLPAGYTDEQAAGHYRIRRRSDEALFGYAVGPHSWKKHLHPASQRLWRAERTGKGFSVMPDDAEPKPLALVGVRACEVQAIAIQDKVFLEGQYVDSTYASRRRNLFIVAVNCGQPGGTCFCVSMKSGPRVSSGFDLALTEVLADDRHFFVVETGSKRGIEVLSLLSHRLAVESETAVADHIVDHAATQMGRQIETEGIRELLFNNHDHPRWDEVASRCLTCANCTMVCPTCFCTTVEDVTDLTGQHAERWRRWDSCFTIDFSYLHGGSVRKSSRSRYRQWLTHKLSSWWDQFGSSGCVGCGRCITWCPVGIDITEEVRAIRGDDDS